MATSETDKRWKGRKIDWLEIADMDSEVYELKPLNQQQVAILLMLLDYQKWTTRWENLEMSKAELTRYIGDIEDRLMRNEGFSMTPDELKQAIRDGMYWTINDVAKQIVSGRVTNINVDDTGNVSDPTTDGVTGELPEDDPATVDIDESAAAEMGGAIAVCMGLEKMFDMLDTKYGNTNGSPLIPEAQMTGILHSYFPSDETLLATGVASYYNWRLTQPALNFNTSSTFSRYMYCHGSDKDAFNRYLIDISGYAESRRVVYAALVEALTDEFWSGYFAYGAKVPSVDYKAASCTPIPVEEFDLDMSTANAPAYTTSGVWKAGHRFLIEVSGSFSDSTGVGETGIVGDGMYFHTLSSGVKTFSSMGFNFGGAVTPPTQAQVPFQASHIYNFTVEKLVASGDAAGIISRDNGAMNLPGVTGILHVKVTDLGEFAL